jgi:hypothetical protein
MTLWERVKKFYSERKYKPLPTEVESSRQKLRWNKARFAIRQMSEYPLFKEWLEDAIYYRLGRIMLELDVAGSVAEIKILDWILDEIEKSTLDQIAIDERNLKILEEKIKR